MLADFFIAPAAEVQSLDITQTPATGARCLRTKRIDPVKIVQLQCCFDGVPFAERMPLLNTMLVRQAGEDGPWIFQLPKAVENQLATARTDELDRLGKLWAATEEWTRDGGTPQIVVPLLTTIAHFAVEARAQRQSVYIWMSL
jgi:hypothetical protein